MSAGHSGFSISGGPTYGFHGHGKGFVNDDEDMKSFGKHSVWECCCVTDENMDALRQLISQAKANVTKKSFGNNPESYPEGAYSVIVRGTGKPPFPMCHGQSAYFAHIGLPSISLAAAKSLPSTLEGEIRASPSCRLKEKGANFYKVDESKRKD